MPGATSSPEMAVKRLSRHPPNTTCPNCGTHSKYGFSTVCVKYNTFVCNSCKSAHQAVSHRCKSLTMSSWTSGEVLALSSPKTGGNDRARRVWLGNAPPVGTGGRPMEGSDVNVFKRFIVEAYEDRRYYREEEVGEEKARVGADGPLPSRTTTTTIAAPAVAARRPPPPFAAPVKAPQAQASAPDLLDFFGAFDAAVVAAPLEAAVAPPPPPLGSSSGGDPFFDPFGEGGGGGLGGAMAGPPATAPATSDNGPASFDPFFGGVAAPVAPLIHDGSGMMMNGGGAKNIMNAMVTNGLGVDCGVNLNSSMPVMNANNGNNWQLQYQQQQQYKYQQQLQPTAMMMMNANNNFNLMKQQPQPQQRQQQHPPFLDNRTMGGINYNNNDLVVTSDRPATNATGAMGWGAMGGSSAAVGLGGFIPSASAPAAIGSGNNKPDPFAGLGF